MERGAKISAQFGWAIYLNWARSSGEAGKPSILAEAMPSIYRRKFY